MLVVRWIDRLGRNYDDIIKTIREFMRRGVIIRTVINNMTFDGATRDPVQKAVRDALIGFMAATARGVGRGDRISTARRIEYAKQVNGCAYLGRKPSFTRAQFEAVRQVLSREKTLSQIAKSAGLTRQSSLSHQDNPASEAALAAWGL